MKTVDENRPKISCCPPVLSVIHSRPSETASEQRLSKSRGVLVPLFIEWRLLCALQTRQQGSSPLPADNRPRVRTTRARLVKTRAGANRPGARQANDC